MLSNGHQLDNHDWHDEYLHESARDGMCFSFVCDVGRTLRLGSRPTTGTSTDAGHRRRLLDYRKRGSGRDAAHVVVVASQHHVAVDSPTGTIAKIKYTNDNQLQSVGYTVWKKTYSPILAHSMCTYRWILTGAFHTARIRNLQVEQKWTVTRTRVNVSSELVRWSLSSRQVSQLKSAILQAEQSAPKIMEAEVQFAESLGSTQHRECGRICDYLI